MSKLQSLYEQLKEQEQDEGFLDNGIGIEKWRELGENGAAIPIRIPVHGFSMMPLIRPEKDMITIMPLIRAPMVGDIVMFRRGDGKYIVHRVYRTFKDGIQTWGDNCLNADAPRKLKDVFGIVVSLERDGKIYQTDTDKHRDYGIRWMKYGRPAWTVQKRIRIIGGKIIRCFYPHFHEK